MALLLCGRRLLLSKKNILSNTRSGHGYIVLVPEIGEDLPDKNPLVLSDGLPEFNNFTIERCVAAIGKQTADVDKKVKLLEETIKDKENINVVEDILDPLEQIGAPLETTWGIAKTLYLGNSSLMPTKQYLLIHERARRARGSKFNSLPIYNGIKNAQATATELNEEEKRLVGKYLVEGKLNGVDLETKNKLKLNEVIDKLGQERAKFRGKIETSIKHFSQIIEAYSMVRDFPPNLLLAMSTDPKQPTKGPWRVTLQPFIVNSFLEYCPDRNLRWNAWQANTRKASGYMEKGLENSTHLEEIRYLRKTQAELLGYKNFVEMSMETKMAGCVENVKKMITDLSEKAKPAMKNELKNLQKFATECGYDGPLEEHDIMFYKRKQIKNLYKYDDEILREYFSLPKVLNGLLVLAENLFGIRIEERININKWHEDVKYFDVFDYNNVKDPIGGFYVDMYAREDEKIFSRENNGWMVGIRNKSLLTNTTPLASLIFNFPQPMYGKPSLLSFKDVQLLFHKFGQTLQHLLTKTTYSDLAGLSNVEWDAVNVCSHLMTNLLDDENTIKLISAHYSTEEPLTDEQIKSIQIQKKHLAGYELCRELYLSDLDLELHTSTDFWLNIVKNTWPKYNLIPLDKKDAHPCSLTQIFSGDYGAAYFSFIWSRVVAADVYSAFYEARNNKDEIQVIGERFRNTFLTYGGACHPSEVFRRFRGRDPSPKALLTSLGLNKTKVTTDDK